MVAYNFKSAFVVKIRSGVKRNTIRRNGKKRHARVGEMLQLYTGMRTKSCEKIIPDVPCIAIAEIEIRVEKPGLGWIALDNAAVLDLEEFAIGDGFSGAEQMHRFWLQTYGVGTFRGAFIQWDPTEALRSDASIVKEENRK